WTLNTSDLGGATGFAVYVTTVVIEASGNSSLGDVAPGTGRWVVDIAGPLGIALHAVTPVIGKPVTVPANVTAGKRITVSFPVTITGADPTTPAPSATITSQASIAGKAIHHNRSFVGGVARLSFVVPKSARAKRLNVKVTVKQPSYQGEDGIAIDIGTGYMGIVASRYMG